MERKRGHTSGSSLPPTLQSPPRLRHAIRVNCEIAKAGRHFPNFPNLLYHPCRTDTSGVDDELRWCHIDSREVLRTGCIQDGVELIYCLKHKPPRLILNDTPQLSTLQDAINHVDITVQALPDDH